MIFISYDGFCASIRSISDNLFFVCYISNPRNIGSLYLTGRKQSAGVHLTTHHYTYKVYQQSKPDYNIIKSINSRTRLTHNNFYTNTKSELDKFRVYVDGCGIIDRNISFNLTISG